MIMNYYKYHLPFANSFQTNKKTFENREGIFIEYISEEFQCYGEVAPLPGYSKETLDDVQQVLGNTKDIVEIIFDNKNPVEGLRAFYKEENIPASQQFGLESIAYQIQAYRSEKKFREYLFPEAPNKILVNALVSLQPERYLKEVEKQVSKGFQTIKFKVGMNFEREFRRLKKIRSHFPNVTIRIDVNQAWTADEASRNCQKLETLNIEYCEEPLKNPTPENFEILSSSTKLPLALDESLYQVTYWPNLLPYTSYLVFKPMLLGSFTRFFETKRFADTHDNKVVFTTSLESGIGRGITAVIASGIGAPQTAHGLTTGKLLAKDVHSDTSHIANGFYNLDKLPNLSNKISYNLQEVSSKLFSTK
jgi:O-succinylbenzoate synthase